LATKQLTYRQKGSHTLKQTHTPQLRNNQETYKTKNTKEILPGSHRLIKKDTVTKHQICMGKQQKKNPENKQLQTFGSTQAMTVSQHTSTTSKSSATTTAQYSNWRTQ
jgi:hypothetical protein